MASRSIIIIFSILFITGINACKTTKTQTTPLVTYTKDVKSIIDMNCGNRCHNATRPADGIDLTTYEKVKAQTLNGKLLMAIQHMEGAEPMPKNSPKLDDSSIQTLIDWANSGAAL